MEIKRKNLPSKNKSKTLDEQRKIANVFGSLSAVLFLVCFIMGAGLIQSDDRISDLEAKLSKLDQSYKYILTQVKQDNVQSVFAESNENNMFSEVAPILTESSTKTTTEITTENTTEAYTKENTTIQSNTHIFTETTTENTTNLSNLSEAKSYTTYKVKDGDSLEAISKKFYGNRDKIDEIMEVNEIDDANKIYSGMILKLP